MSSADLPHSFQSLAFEMHSLTDYKNKLIDFLKATDGNDRTSLLLVTMQIHTNLFGDAGDDPRSMAIHAIENSDLAQYATNQ